MTAKAWHAGTAVGQQTFAFSTSCALHLWTPHLDRIVTVFKKPAGRLSPLFSSLTKIIYVELVEFSLSLSLPPPPPVPSMRQMVFWFIANWSREKGGFPSRYAAQRKKWPTKKNKEPTFFLAKYYARYRWAKAPGKSRRSKLLTFMIIISTWQQGQSYMKDFF